jgi:hypothetical protein
MVKVIGPSSRIVNIGPPSPSVERQGQEIRAECYRLDIFMREQAVDAELS